MNRFVKYIVAALLVTAVSKGVTKLFTKDESQQVKEFVGEFNKTLPKKVDDALTLTHTEGDKTKLRFHYDVNPESSFDPANEFQYKQNLKKNVCSGAMRELMERGMGVDFLLHYKRNEEPLILSLSISKGDC